MLILNNFQKKISFFQIFMTLIKNKTQIKKQDKNYKENKQIPLNKKRQNKIYEKNNNLIIIMNNILKMKYLQ